MCSQESFRRTHFQRELITLIIAALEIRSSCRWSRTERAHVACQLRRLGVSVRIVDKKAGFSATSKAIGLQYRVSEILACMGVADRLLAKGNTLIAVNILFAIAGLYS